MGDGDVDLTAAEQKASAKRKRIESLDRRFGGSHGASPRGSSAKASGGGSGGRDGDRRTSALRGRDPRGFHGGGRGRAHPRPQTWGTPKPSADVSSIRPWRGQGEPESSGGGPNGDGDGAPDATWYAPISRRTRSGVLAAAHARSVPVELIETHADATAGDSKRARTEYVERFLLTLAETNPRSGADVQRAVRSKTRDKVVLLDAANAGFAVEDAKKNSKRNERVASRIRTHASRSFLRVAGARGALPKTISPSPYAAFGPLRTGFHEMVTGSIDGIATSSAENHDSEATQRILREARNRIAALGEIRGGILRVVSCRAHHLVGVVGVVARVAARTIQIVTESDRTVLVPRRGSTFRLEIELPKLLRETIRIDVKGEHACAV